MASIKPYLPKQYQKPSAIEGALGQSLATKQDKYGGLVTTGRSGGGGGGGSSTSKPAPAPVIVQQESKPTINTVIQESQLKSQQKVEQITKEPNFIAPQKSYAQKQVQEIKEGSFFGTRTIGDIQRQAREEKVQSLVEGFQRLTPEQAKERFIAGEKGYGGYSTSEGEVITFSTDPYQQEIKQAGSLKAVKGKVTAKNVGASALLGAGRFALGVPEFVVEDVLLGATMRTGKTGSELRQGVDIKFFDKGIFGSVKQKPTDVVQIGTEITGNIILTKGVTKGFIKGVKSEGLATTVKSTAGSLSPLQVKGGIYTPSASKITGVELEESFGGVKTITRGGRTKEGINELTFGAVQKTPTGSVTKGITFQESPAIVIKGGGAIVETGTLTTATQFSSRGFNLGTGRKVTGKGTQDLLLGEPLTAGGGVSIEKPKFSILETEKGSQLFKYPKNKASVRRFGVLNENLGEGLSRITGGSIFEVQKSPTKIAKKVKSNIDVDVLRFKKSDLGDFKITGSNKNIKQITQTKSDFLPSVQRQPVQLSDAGIKVVGARPSDSLQTIQQKTKTKQIISPRQQNSFIEPLSFKQPGISVFKTKQKSTTSAISLPKQQQTIQPGQKGLLNLGLSSIQREELKQPQKSRAKEIIGNEPLSTTGFGSSFFRYNYKVPPILALPPALGIPSVRKGKAKSKRKFKRRPSYVSAELNIRSSKPLKGEYTGLVARPII